jgi:hypothetical protein
MLSAATLKSLCKQIEFFERAARYEGRPREKVVALGEAESVYFHLYPHHYRALQTIRIASQLGRLAAYPNDPLHHCESRLISLLMNILLEALQNGDLQLRERQRPGELAFTLWSLAFGTRALMDTGVATRQLGIEDGFRASREASDLLLDALRWAPTSDEQDYAAVRKHVRESLFQSEWDELMRSVRSAEPSIYRPK